MNAVPVAAVLLLQVLGGIDARRGYAVYLLDVRNFGGSTREKVMDEPPRGNPAPSRSHEAIRDISATVEHVLARHGLSQVNPSSSPGARSSSRSSAPSSQPLEIPAPRPSLTTGVA